MTFPDEFPGQQAWAPAFEDVPTPEQFAEALHGIDGGDLETLMDDLCLYEETGIQSEALSDIFRRAGIIASADRLLTKHE